METYQAKKNYHEYGPRCLLGGIDLPPLLQIKNYHKHNPIMARGLLMTGTLNSLYYKKELQNDFCRYGSILVFLQQSKHFFSGMGIEIDNRKKRNFLRDRKSKSKNLKKSKSKNEFRFFFRSTNFYTKNFLKEF